jgi:hypothetical protein
MIRNKVVCYDYLICKIMRNEIECYHLSPYNWSNIFYLFLILIQPVSDFMWNSFLKTIYNLHLGKNTILILRINLEYIENFFTEQCYCFNVLVADFLLLLC